MSIADKEMYKKRVHAIKHGLEQLTGALPYDAITRVLAREQARVSGEQRLYGEYAKHITGQFKDKESISMFSCSAPPTKTWTGLYQRMGHGSAFLLIHGVERQKAILCNRQRPS